MGVHDDASSRPVAGDHEHETPPDPVRPVEAPAQMVADPEATATGAGTFPTFRLIFAKS
jgi:hypothetical protein